MKHSYLPEQIQQLRANTARAEQLFGALSPTQLNWKPDPKSWSVGQCIDHLITSNQLYFATFSALESGSYKPGLWTKISPFSGMFGRMLLKGTGPELTQKMSVPKAFAPTQSSVPADIISQFVTHQNQLIKHYELLENLTDHSTKIPSPAAGFITYSLEIGLRILPRHEQRHLNQAERVTQLPGFPKN